MISLIKREEKPITLFELVNMIEEDIVYAEQALARKQNSLASAHLDLARQSYDSLLKINQQAAAEIYLIIEKTERKIKERYKI